MKLNISDDLKLPLEAVTETFAVMGIRGSGKTHTASVMAEEMLKAGQPIVVYDPTGAWFGLKVRRGRQAARFPGGHLRRRASRCAVGRKRR
jgi:DNA helicase HerA-like ATPase